MLKTITVTQRSDDFHACLKDHPEIWGCGKTVDSAIGDLIRSHVDTFEIAVEHSQQGQRS